MKLLGRTIRGGVFAVIVCLQALVAPAVTVAVDSDCAEMGSVAWSEKPLKNGTIRLTLKATAAEGFVFREWTIDDDDVIAWTDDLRYPGTLTAIVATNAEVSASFVACADDSLSFDISCLFPEEIDCGVDFSETLSVDSESFPTVTFRNLPPGLSFDERTLTVFGQPDAPGLYRVEADAVNESGFTFCSCCTVRVRNFEDVRVSGIDTDIPVDEYFYSEIGTDDISDIFSFSETPSSVALYGSVPGLTWSNNWSVIFGTPTEIGEYTLKVKAEFPTGRVETATMTLSVMGADPEEYGLDLGVFDMLQVGDELDESCQLGEDTSEVKITGVTGLPKGLSAISRYDSEKGARCWFVTGTVLAPGNYKVVVTLQDRSGEAARSVKVVQSIEVADVPDVYLAASSENTERGTVSGGGAVSQFEDVQLVATPNDGSVFSGWYDHDGVALVLQENVDYRTAAVTLPAGTDFSFLSPVAHFASKADDAAPDLSELEDSEFSFAPDEMFETEFSVESLSLPTLTFKGLPSGVYCEATGSGGFVLRYDPEAAVAVSKRYTVTATATNASGAKSTVNFRITVEAQSNERINVYDDYGEFTPGETIDPIDLSDAVDFARGETLSVAGLPKGLAYNAKANAKKGIDAYTITGTPTVPGDYTLTFTAKVVAGATTNRQGKVSYKYETVRATAFLTVLAYPELEIEIDADAAAAGCKVTGAGNYKAGTKVSLKATAAKGWVFAGWGSLDEVEGLAALNPKLAYVTGDYDVWTQASFVPVSEDGLTINAPILTENGFAAEWPLEVELDDGSDAALIADLINTVSWPTVKVEGLPSGVKFSSSTFLLSGKPKKSGVYHVTVTAKSAGGYSFVRVLDIAVKNADGSLPVEKALPNAAKIDFAPLRGLTTGVYCPTGAVVLAIGPNPDSGSPVKKVAVSGLPSGLKTAVSLLKDGAVAEVTGTPTKPGRQTVSISVTYADGKALKSQTAVVVEDGGSFYLFVASGDPNSGTVSGEGVYASGATVKLVAKPKSKQVFAGWYVADGEEGYALFAPLRDIDGIDPRTSSVSFIFRPADFSDEYEIVGSFVPAAEDLDAVVALASDCWKIDPAESSALSFAVDSFSVPKVTVTGLPKGVMVDAVRGQLSYAPSAATAPGVYQVAVSAKNATQKKATVQALEVQVANRVSEVIEGLDPDVDAYPLSVGTTLDSSLIAPTVGAAWKLTAKGLPSGLSLKNGVVSGVPSKAGDYTVTFTATTGKGKTQQTETATITLRVSALPTALVGTFCGVLTDASSAVKGTVAVTTTAAGKVTVAVQTAAKKFSFTAKSWDEFADDKATVSMVTKSGQACTLQVAATSDWRSWQASGMVRMEVGADDMAFLAQRNPYGSKDGDSEALAIVKNMAGTSKIDGWTVKLSNKGVVSIAGKLSGKSISGSTILQWEDDSYIGRYVKIVNKNSLYCLTFVFGDDGKVVSWQVDE